MRVASSLPDFMRTSTKQLGEDVGSERGKQSKRRELRKAVKFRKLLWIREERALLLRIARNTERYFYKR